MARKGPGGGGLPPVHPSAPSGSALKSSERQAYLPSAAGAGAAEMSRSGRNAAGVLPRPAKPVAQGSPVVDVWASNFEEEMRNIMEIVEDYPFIAMDTEFPGIVSRPLGTFPDAPSFHYSTLKANVDMLTLIQLGITFFDAQGRVRGENSGGGKSVPLTHTWQFHFNFNLEADVSAPDSIELLQSAGLDFARHARDGIELRTFGEAFTVSGLVLNEAVSWVTFHGGYDFGYLLKATTCLPLPATRQDFFSILRLYFPNMYDVKYLSASLLKLRGGLQQLANDLKVARVGRQHQAGSDAYVTGCVFFNMYQNVLKADGDGKFELDEHNCVIYGLNSPEEVASGALTAASGGSHDALYSGMKSGNSYGKGGASESVGGWRR